MDSKNKSHHHLLFLLPICFIWVVVACFVLFQYGREKTSRAELLDASLQLLNMRAVEALHGGISLDDFFADNSDDYSGLRLTLINADGDVEYDSWQGEDISQMGNHLSRPEVAAALANGHGYTVRRLSESTAEEYFYSAMAADTLIIRSALPYNVSLSNTLSVGHSFMWFMIAMTLMISAAGVYLFRRMKAADQRLESEQRRAMWEQQEKIRIKKQLTNNINHELKTPVSAVKGCLETLLDNPTIAADMRDRFVKKSYEQILRLENLLRDVSSITRMDEAGDVIRKEPVSLSAVIAGVVDDIGAGNELPVRINTNIPAGDPLTIAGNEQLLRSIFSNLIGNALSYSGCRDIFIDFTGTKSAEGKEFFGFRFADNGIGVEEEHLPHLFERFYRVDKGRSRKLGGTGLGLSIVRNAVTIHGGEIEVHNRPEGGLEFTFTLQKS